MEIKYQALDALTYLFQTSSRYKHGAEAHYYECREDLGYLKNEIMENLISLQDFQKKPYLQNIKHKIYESAGSTLEASQLSIISEDYSELLKQFGINEAPINEIIEGRDRTDYSSLFYELVTFDTDDLDDLWDIEYRELKGQEWVRTYFKLFYCFPYKSIEYTVNQLNKFIKEQEIIYNLIPPEQLPVKKEAQIKWKSSPIHFGYVINEFINNGFFDELPLHNGEVNYSEIARLFGSIINFDTTEQTLQKAFNPQNDKLSETVKKKFVIPLLKDIKPKNKSVGGKNKTSAKTPVKSSNPRKK
jgi:hypothetical protein